MYEMTEEDLANKLLDEMKDNGYKDYNDMIRKKILRGRAGIMKVD